ncbi:helicase RepA family protein [Silvimonas sp.]|uniref:helicase RepA family protein n=1 Tax=Silvimonas sp. TaxID=2650811 RepID=UPI00283C3327|nr:helicase RepA family protein [Silvimonas sp.]MDR3429599.1 helicase RepA family protein [Silvimonas sp.]
MKSARLQTAQTSAGDNCDSTPAFPVPPHKIAKPHNGALNGAFILDVEPAPTAQPPSPQVRAGNPAEKVPCYRLLSASDLADLPPLTWLIRNVLPTTGFGAIFGASGCGKTFMLLDLCHAIAAGRDWFGRRTKAVPVVYLGLEGEAGLKQRVQAWQIQNDGVAPEKRLLFITQPFDLLSPIYVNALAECLLSAGLNNGLLVIDTLNRAAPGADENTSTDMGRIIQACKELQQRIGGLVLLVHHTGKDSSKGLRGHSSLYASLDVVVEIAVSGTLHTWTLMKNKDGKDGISGAFSLAEIEVGLDEDGEPLTSCAVVEEQTVEGKPSVKPPGGKNQKLILDAIGQALAALPLDQANEPGSKNRMALEDVHALAAKVIGGDPSRAHAQAKSIIKNLKAQRHLIIDADYVSLP